MAQVYFNISNVYLCYLVSYMAKFEPVSLPIKKGRLETSGSRD